MTVLVALFLLWNRIPLALVAVAVVAWIFLTVIVVSSLGEQRLGEADAVGPWLEAALALTPARPSAPRRRRPLDTRRMPDANGSMTSSPTRRGPPRSTPTATRTSRSSPSCASGSPLVARGGGDEAVARTRGAASSWPASASTACVDPGSPFLELSPLAAWDMYDGDAPAAGIVTGIGIVGGREVAIVANDATVKGGTYFPMTVKKHLRAAGNRRGESAAVRLPRRLRRRVPAAPGRRVPRPRPLRPDLLQPGQPVGRRASRRSRSSWARARPAAPTFRR